ncbi:phage holin family protein [Pseudomonas sp. LS1212]|nr:phage holin family protein [Pseudomonas sp. LS1212]UVJ43135.1 phage holin family protein [Pseudomonas sp. LS1212]
MTEPASTSISSLYLGLGLASFIPLINGDALFGALLGAWLVASTRQSLKAWQRMGSLLLSAGVGYLFTPLVLSMASFLSSGVAAFVGAVVVIPISIKVMVWLDGADLREVFQRLRGGR